MKRLSETLRVAKPVPNIACGWSPGEATIASSVMKSNPPMAVRMQYIIQVALDNLAGGIFLQ